MAYTTINKSSDFFNTVTYSGSETPQTITGVNFSADMAWFKNRTGTAAGGNIYDTVRGISDGWLYTNETAASNNAGQPQITLNSDGYVLNSGYDLINDGSSTYVSWNWKAGGGQGSSNTDGSINTAYTSVNTTAGFSISSYTGNATSGATVGHGLGVAPKVIFVKCTSTSSTNWIVYTAATGNTHWMYLNATNAAGANSAAWNNTSPTSSVFSLGNDGDVNGSGRTYIAYCFAEKTGYSKFGSYTANNSTDGAFVYTGFAPKFAMIKNITSGSSHMSWCMVDSTRSTNPNIAKTLYANRNYSEGKRGEGTASTTIPNLDLLSNGMKMRISNDELNTGTETYIYMAFGQSLVGSNNIPATAR